MTAPSYDLLRFDPGRQSGAAVLAAADTGGDDAPTLVNGVALAPEVTEGLAKRRIYWPADVLREAAPLLEGKPLVRDHPDVAAAADGDGIDIEAQPPIESVIGEVTETRYEDGTGLLYQAELDAPDVARQVERERVAVSAVLGFELDQWDDEREAYVADSITGFRDLGVVARGAFSGASIEPGETPAQPSPAAAMSADALAAAFGEQKRDDTGGTRRGTEKSTMSDSDHDQQVEQLQNKLEAEREQRENLSEENTEMKQVFAEALADDSPFSADTIAERFSFEEISENFDGEPTEALTAEPVSGGSSGGSGGEGGVDALSRDEKEKLEVLTERKRLMSNRGLDNHVEKINGEIEALVGSDGGDN